MRTLAVTVVQESSAELGLIQTLVASGPRVWGAGGTSFQATCVYSHDGGRSFVRWSTPPASGLRGICLDGDRVWVAGEDGVVAHTDAGDGEDWERVEVGVPDDVCLYAIKRCSNGLLTVMGDAAFVAHSKTGRRWRRVNTEMYGAERVFDLQAEPGGHWLVSSHHELRRWTPSGYVKAAIPTQLWPRGTPRPLCGVTRSHSGALILVGDGGMILRSPDDGATWTHVPTDTENDLERVLITRLGVFVIGDHGSLLVSYDGGRSFQGFATALAGHLWSLVEVGGDLLIGGERGQIWRVEQRELAAAMRDAFAGRDRVIAELASRVVDGDAGAELVLEDAIRERELW